MRRAVFLDRDGVINRSIICEGKPFPPASLDELVILPGVNEALSLLRAAGYRLIVVTNQPDVSRGTTTKNSVEALNASLQDQLPIDAFFSCYHDDSDHCLCRKPKPGLLLAAAKKFNVNVARSYMVGDRWRDIEAGLAVGCKTFFVDYGYTEKQPELFDFRVNSLREAAIIIIGEE